MFGWLKKGKDDPAKPADATPAAPVSATTDAPKRSKEELIQEAMANAKLARVAIGEETLNKVAEIIEKKNREMQLAKAREALINMKSEVLADHLKEMLRDKKTEN